MVKYCYVEFKVFNDDKLLRLTDITHELSRHKANGTIEDESYWRAKFEPDELSYFSDLSEAQLEEWNEFWFATPLPQRHSAEMPSPGWDFGSMIEAIYNGDYVLLGVKSTKNNLALLEIDPIGWPYGGMDSLRALVRCFNHEIIGFENGSEPYVRGDPQAPLWTPKTGG